MKHQDEKVYPKEWACQPVAKPLLAVCPVPGSKSITNRALVLAALNSGNNPIILKGVLQSEDTEVMIQCLRDLGFSLNVNWTASEVIIQSPLAPGKIPAAKANLFTANSGTTLRFLTAMVSLGQGNFRLDGIERMRERPVADLLDALKQLGVQADCEKSNGCPPVIITSQGWKSAIASIKAETSSQFLSGLLMAAPFAGLNVEINLEGQVVSQPYIDITLAMLRDWGFQIHQANSRQFLIQGGQEGRIREYTIEPDASAASYFFAAAAITGGKVTVPGLGKNSLQGDIHFASLLGQMGCQVEMEQNQTTVIGGNLKGIDVDMNAISDTVMTLGVTACFAEGQTRIRNVAHIRHKETDRIRAMAVELGKLGARVVEFGDGLQIHPGNLRGAAIDTYNDHRIAMSFALASLKIPGMVIKDPGCVRKTYPDFFEDFEKAIG
ncbi:MAG: 3-phosphoshikimate 1-carboxyvinyltransferase [Gemmataceae bacterium]|nr:3-phosphoshikimate 1-carboxyvinyltransferase [Gemmataceae bacterium]